MISMLVIRLEKIKQCIHYNVITSEVVKTQNLTHLRQK